MSRRPVAAIVKDWKTKQSPSSLEARLATNPNVLCSGHSIFTLKALFFLQSHASFWLLELLLRFGIAWHPQTKLNWAFPTIKKINRGFGYYVKLDRKILYEIQKGGYKAIFRSNTVAFRTDMIEHTETLLRDQTFLEFNKHHLHMYDVFSSPADLRCMISASDYQCILVLDSIIEEDDMDIHMPYYYLHQIWSKEQMDTVASKLSSSACAIGIPRRTDTVRLAIDFWRCKQFLTT
ncbi:MAG: hypothetical protein EXX96DRAFT_534215 [Benjaminiella poitrasii]|nr:MAG: hypothetical protein EXX96DRAFT_534215 [Benjaminiella poitrasii]